MGFYLWCKGLHVIAVISWLAGLLYLPRLFAYHAGADRGTAQTLAVMERRLLRVIMNPAMIATWILGLAMLGMRPELLGEVWVWTKGAAVLALSMLHITFARWRRRLEVGDFALLSKGL